MKKDIFKTILAIMLVCCMAMVISVCKSTEKSNGAEDVFVIMNDASGVAESSDIGIPEIAEVGTEGWTFQTIAK